MYDDRTNLGPAGDAKPCANTSATGSSSTVIPRNVRLAEAPSHGKPVALYDPRSRGTEAYFELAGEFLARNSMESPRSIERKVAAANSRPNAPEVRFWPYS